VKKSREYQCAVCKGVFKEGWSHEEAAEEFYARHPGQPIDDTTTVICDDCYQLLMRDMKANPWRYAGLK
jgi:hypothetical protein